MISLVSQGAVTAADPLLPYVQYGVGAAMLGVLGFVVRVLQTTHKDNADRGAAQQKACDERNDRTVATVDRICDRFSETQATSAKLFADTVSKLEVEAARREERLHDTLRELRSAPKGG